MTSREPRCCVIVPCYNHGSTVGNVVRAAARQMPVLVVDDGSTDETPRLLATLPCHAWVRTETNQGKGTALQTGFRAATEAGFTHAITVDADGQHDVTQVELFRARCAETPRAVLVGVRNLRRAGAPLLRRFANAFSNLWFRIETGIRLADTQCGFRCYPLERTRSLRTTSRRYGYELEILVHASWADVPLVPLDVGVSYDPEKTGRSHFRWGMDFARIARIHTRLTLQAFCLPRPLRSILVRGELHGMPWPRRLAVVVRKIGTEHTNPPTRIAFAVALGLFCGIAPIWGYQMAAAACGAHRFRLNKAIALLASNISFPLAAPFILAAGLALGHWLLYGQALPFSTAGLHENMGRYFWAWAWGSIVLAAGAATTGFLVTSLVAYGIRAFRRLR